MKEMMIRHYFNASSTTESFESAASSLETEIIWERIKTQSIYSLFDTIPYSLATWTISAIQIIIHIIDRLTPRPILFNYLSFDSSHKYQIWRMFTHALVHKRRCDLVSNLHIQLLLGRHLETYLSSQTFLILYIFSVYAGACSFYLVQSKLVSGAHVPAFVILTIHGVISVARVRNFKQFFLFNMIELIQSACFVLEVTALLKLTTVHHHYAYHKLVGLIIGSSFARALDLERETLVFNVTELSYHFTIVCYYWYFCIFKLEAFVFLWTRQRINQIYSILMALGVNLMVLSIYCF